LDLPLRFVEAILRNSASSIDSYMLFDAPLSEALAFSLSLRRALLPRLSVAVVILPA